MPALPAALLLATLAQVQPRTPLVSPPLPETLGGASLVADDWLLEVKFADDLRVRADATGAPRGTADRALPAALESFFTAHPTARLTPLIRVDDARVERLVERARNRTGVAQPDLLGLHRLQLAGDARTLLEAARELRGVEGVEFVQLVRAVPAPPGDIAPPTGDYTGLQTYAGPDPGLDFAALLAAGATGAGIRVSDCEYAWDVDHEDLVDIGIQSEPGQTPTSQSLVWRDHGTAVTGIVAAPHNAYGVDGVAPGASIAVYPEYTNEGGWRRVDCITQALADSAPGDVVLLEMQILGGNLSYSPAEWDLAVWMATRVGTDAGVVVVAAAGNGSQDLDSSAFDSYRQRGDSGAIVVGAGAANSTHGRLSFSNYGERVNVQAWGENVVSAGYGDLALVGGDAQQSYTESFAGTSSASALIAGACALVQNYATQRGYPRLDSRQMRAVLRTGGIPATSGGAIGLFPNLAAVRDALDGGTFAFCPPTANGTSAAGATLAPNAAPLASGPPLTLQVAGAAAGEFGLLLAGGGPDRLAVGGGFLCIGDGPIAFRRVEPPVLLDATGAADFTIDPQSFAGGLVAGDTLYLQFWFRDPNGAHGGGSNTSEARVLHFLP